MEEQQSTSKSPHLLFIGIPVMLLIIGIGSYVFTFASEGFSDKQEVWAHFGDYMNFWVTLASLFAVVALTFYIHKREEQQKNESREREDALNRPFVVFLYTNHMYHYAIKNIGKGPALDIKVSYKPSERENYVTLESQTPLGAGDITDFTEYDYERAGPMVAVYSDILGNKITTYYTSNNENIIKVNHDEFAFASQDVDPPYKYSPRPEDPHAR